MMSPVVTRSATAERVHSIDFFARARRKNSCFPAPPHGCSEKFTSDKERRERTRNTIPLSRVDNQVSEARANARDHPAFTPSSVVQAVDDGHFAWRRVFS